MQLKNQRFFLWFNKLVFPLFYLRHQGKESVIINADANTRFHVRVNTSDILVIWEIWKAKIYDDATFRVGAYDTVLDIGAHIGGFSIRAAQWAEHGRVFAYEASGKNFAVLTANRTLNNVPNLHIHHTAVSNQQGELKFFLPGHNGALGSLLQDAASPSETVQAVTLQGILETHQLKQIDYLKLDVEGAEYDILAHCTPQTLASVRRIVMEYHEFVGDPRTHRDLVRLLEAHGFHVVVEAGIFPQKILFGTGIIKAWRD